MFIRISSLYPGERVGRLDAPRRISGLYSFLFLFTSCKVIEIPGNVLLVSFATCLPRRDNVIARVIK